MYDHVKEYISDDGTTEIDVDNEQEPLTSVIPAKEQFQLKRSLEIVDGAMKDLTMPDKLKHSLILIRHELVNISAISRKFHLNLFEESKIAMIVMVNWHLTEMNVFTNKDMANFKQHFKSLKYIVDNRGEGFY